MRSRLLQSCSFQWAIANRSALKPESWERAEPGQTAGAPWPCPTFSDDSRRLRPRRIEEGLVPALLHGYLRATANKQVRTCRTAPRPPPEHHPRATRVPPEWHRTAARQPPECHSAAARVPRTHVHSYVRTCVPECHPSASQKPAEGHPRATRVPPEGPPSPAPPRLALPSRWPSLWRFPSPLTLAFTYVRTYPGWPQPWPENSPLASALVPRR